jgi:transcription elongation factor GreA
VRGRDRQLEPITFTQQGFEKIKTEREDLFTERKIVLERVKEARAMGDLSENGYYQAAKAKLRSIDHRLVRLGDLLKRGVVANPGKGTVGIGSKVMVKTERETKTFHIVGKFEADPFSNKISHISPIGRALMGKKDGDTVLIEVPNGTIAYTIIMVT